MKLPIFLLLVLGGMMIANVGCGTLEGDRGWGQDAIYPVRWERIPQAAKRALLDPVTWAPAVGAAVFAIDDFDQRVSDWAVDRHPIFGSEQGAEDYSDYVKDGLIAEAYSTILITPSGDEFWTWTTSKARGAVVEAAASLATSSTTYLIKDVTNRERPDESGNHSFPSGHSSTSFSAARLANRNLDSVAMPVWTRTTLKAANITLAGSVAWARVEARRHYPSDVLAGAALGNFLTTFIHDAFMNLPEDDQSAFSFYLEPSPSGFWGVLSWEF